jgi:hypothetical protein
MNTRAPSRLMASGPAAVAEYCARRRCEVRSTIASDGDPLFVCDRSET